MAGTICEEGSRKAVFYFDTPTGGGPASTGTATLVDRDSEGGFVDLGKTGCLPKAKDSGQVLARIALEYQVGGEGFQSIDPLKGQAPPSLYTRRPHGTLLPSSVLKKRLKEKDRAFRDEGLPFLARECQGGVTKKQECMVGPSTRCNSRRHSVPEEFNATLEPGSQLPRARLGLVFVKASSAHN